MADSIRRPIVHPRVSAMDNTTWLTKVMKEPREWTDPQGQFWVFDDMRDFTSEEYRTVLRAIKVFDGDSEADKKQREREAASYLSSDDTQLAQTFRSMKDPSTLIRLLAHLHMHKPHRLVFFSDVVLYDEKTRLTILDNKTVHMADVTELYVLMALRRRYADINSPAGQDAALRLRVLGMAEEAKLQYLYRNQHLIPPSWRDGE